jgi:hypothetical protein
VAPPLAVALLLFSFAGCLATDVNMRSGGETTGILVRVYSNADAAKGQRPDAAGTLVELFRLEKGDREVFLQRSLASQWGVDGLAPGRYRLRVVAIVDGGGNIRETRSGDRETDFKVKAGQTAEIKIILKKTPTGLIVAASLTVIILFVALAIILREHDISPPLPPFPSPGDLPHFPLPPGPPINAVVVAPEIWIGPPPGPPGPPVHREQVPPPRVTSVIPEPGALVSGLRVKPTLTFSQPIDESRVTPDTILVLGSASGLLPGTTVMSHGLLRFEPSRDLIPGETVTVTVRAAHVVNPDRRRLERDFSWTFRVTGE